MMLKMFAKLLRVLNSETDPAQISLAFCFAMIAGLTPFMNVHNLVVLLLVLVLRVNLSAFLLGFLFFTGVAYLADPVFNKIGFAVLSSDALNSIWTNLYNTPFVRLTRFNNTIVMGSLTVSLALFVPLYMLSDFLIIEYRENVLEIIKKSRIMRAFQATRFYRVYKKISQLRGAE